MYKTTRDADRLGFHRLSGDHAGKAAQLPAPGPSRTQLCAYYIHHLNRPGLILLTDQIVLKFFYWF